MARADLLLALVRAAVAHDDVGIRSAVGAIAAEERAARHPALAARLERAIPDPALHMAPVVPAAAREPDALVSVTPTKGMDALELPPAVRTRLDSLAREQSCSRRLRDRGLEPRNRVLLSGPPGNGKTSVAGALALALGYPLLTVSHAALVGSQLGETNRRLDRLFVTVARQPAVLFLDEFDALGKERDDGQETGEMKRVVASLLLNIDALPSHVVVVAATNHPGLLDRAIWRRFQMRLELPCPDRATLAAFLAPRLGDPGPAVIDAVSDALAGVSYAEAEDFLQDVARRVALASEGGLAMADAVKLELAERFPGQAGGLGSGFGSDETASPPQSAAGGRPARPGAEERAAPEGLLPW